MEFYITCSDNCLYQRDGICVLTHITSSGGEESKDCPYFRNMDISNSSVFTNIKK